MFSIDTSTPYLVLGLLGDGVAVESAAEVGRAHAEELPGAARALFHAAGLPFRASRVVVGVGPGSYTGLRVGASYALGCGRAWGAVVVGVDSLEGVAARAQGRVAVSADARRGMLYGAVYEVAQGVVTDTIVAPDKFTPQDFAAHAEGAVWLRDEPPSGLALARLDPTRTTKAWQLRYA